MRKRFITFLTHGLTEEQKRDRLLVCHLRNRAGQFTYVHAKNMVVDDVWASVGSSNIGYRSQTYDTEINCDVVDGEIARGVAALRARSARGAVARAPAAGAGVGRRRCSIRAAASRCCGRRPKETWRGRTTSLRTTRPTSATT